MSAEIHKSDIGTTFQVTVKDEDSNVVDVSGATTKQIIFEKPDGTNLEKDASLVTDGTDGKIKYVTLSGDLSEAGCWRMQGYVVLATGTWKTDIHEFIVHENL